MSVLIEKVAKAIEKHFSAADKAYREHHECARDAITAVAEWLGENGKPYEAAALRAAAGDEGK
jgi:hypothetical protein